MNTPVLTQTRWLFLLCLACAPNASTPLDGAGDDRISGADGGEGGGVSGDGTDPGAGGDGGAPATPAVPLRFIALGDAGKGDDVQYQVADAMGRVCAANGCEFALYLGDNFYSDGVSEIDDAQFEEKFELPYAALDFPFHVVAGNHDYGGGGGGFDEWRIALEVEYTGHSDKWTMPAAFYTFAEGDATFFALDTTALDWGRTTQQAAWIPAEFEAALTTWKIGFGHHPVLSNGSHGNANDNFAPFADASICGQMDVYLSGHDHNLQWLESDCPGTEYLVSGGGGAGTYGLDGDNPAWFEEETNGFLWVEIDGRTFTGVFYDADGNELFRRSVTK